MIIAKMLSMKVLKNVEIFGGSQTQDIFLDFLSPPKRMEPEYLPGSILIKYYSI
ncbi:MAG: hypothetical protein PWR20_1318 [Bacteroidales bacterium]|nr:hypothetical protein [Bacteroidales bacterium]MDN5330398.1 hypothetical protein [Bacteroidales bacterium]